jgi:hypothetical protein
VRSILITACGLVALFTPLLLWLAWSQWAFWLIIATGCAALFAHPRPPLVPGRALLRRAGPFRASHAPGSCGA